MHEIDPKFELFDIAQVRAGNWIAGDGAGTGIARLGKTRGTAREFKNSGNKARMLMKTKHITFLKRANQGSLRANPHKSGLEGSKRRFGKTRSGLTAARGGRTGTNCRLHRNHVDVVLAQPPGVTFPGRRFLESMPI
jgi:hypothetical protein